MASPNLEAESEPASSPSVDSEFEPSAEQLLHDYDDEDTMAEEEASGEADEDELEDLTRESEMPLEELLAHYGCHASSSGFYNRNAKSEASTISPTPTTGLSATYLANNVSSSSQKVSVSSMPKLEQQYLSRSHNCDQQTAATSYGGEEEFSDYDDEEEDDDDEVGSSANEDSQHNFNSLRFSILCDESSDPDYDPCPDHGAAPSWKKEIRIGPEYQAVIPSNLQHYDDAPAYENQDRLLWSPLSTTSTNNVDQTTSYCAHIQELNCIGESGSREAAARERYPVPDDEQALYVLQQCGHAFEEALRRTKLTRKACSPSSILSLWSEEEASNFEKGVLHYGKDFHAIQEVRVRTRSVGELVHFYYLWKKTERHDEFMRQCGREKRRCGLHPGYTDYMQGLAREQDLLAENYLLNDRLPHHEEVTSDLTCSVSSSIAEFSTSSGAAAITTLCTSGGSSSSNCVVADSSSSSSRCASFQIAPSPLDAVVTSSVPSSFTLAPVMNSNINSSHLLDSAVSSSGVLS